MFTLYNAVSEDGFIARLDGSEDFIPDSLWADFIKLCEEYKALIIGSHTYDAIQEYDDESIAQFEAGAFRKIVISGDADHDVKPGYILLESPLDAMATAPDALVSSGPTLNDYLLQNHLVGKILQRIVPVSIGEGIPPFEDACGVAVEQLPA